MAVLAVGGKVERVWCDWHTCQVTLIVLGQSAHPADSTVGGAPMSKLAIRYNLAANGWASFPGDIEGDPLDLGLDYCPACRPRLN